jgi:hypothetical protein
MIKYIYIVLIFIFCFGKISAQVAISTFSDPTSILDLSANNKGILIPRLSSAAITNPAKGLVIFNTETKQIETNNGTANAPLWATRVIGATGNKGPKGATGASGVLTFVSSQVGGLATGASASIAGGVGSTASGPNSSVIGGTTNTTSGISSCAIGNINTSSGTESTVVGGSNNASSTPGATIAGGVYNTSSGANSSVVGGYTNVASTPGANTVGGDHNTSSGAGSSLVGGGLNTSSGVNSSLIGGGNSNFSSGVTASVSGGSSNTAFGISATVSGGSNSTASGVTATVSGGVNMKSETYGEWSGGIYGTSALGSATAPSVLDRIFNIGAGSDSINPIDGLTILKNGTSTLPKTTIDLIYNGSNKSIITKEYLLFKKIKIITGTNYILQQSDCREILHFTSDFAVTITVPSGLIENSKFEGKQIGSGQISFEPATLSVSLQKASTDRLNTLGQYSTFKINWISLENYLLSGKLQAL